MTKQTKKDKRTPKARRASAAFGRIMREKSAMAGMATAAAMTFTPQMLADDLAIARQEGEA